MSGTDLLLILLLGAVLVLAALLLAGRRGGAAAMAERLAANFQQALAELGTRVGQLSAEVGGVARQQEAIRGEVAQTREVGQSTLQASAEALTGRIHETQLALQSVTELVHQTVQAQAALAQSLTQVQESVQAGLSLAQTNLRQEITQTRELIGQIQAADAARLRQEQEAFEALKRLENLLAGTKSRGIAGENILEEALSILPPSLRESNVRISNRVVEFALNLPGGKVLPIDSKWPAMALLEQLTAAEDPVLRKRLAEQIERELAKKVEEVRKYLDPERTIGLGILAVPDPVYALCTRAHAGAYKEGVILIGYAQAVPVVLFLLQLLQRFGGQVDMARLSAALQTIGDALEKMDGELEGRFADALKRLDNSRAELRSQLGRARHGVAGLSAQPEGSLGGQEMRHPVG